MSGSHQERTRRFIAGDPLRAIAAMSVLVFHAGLFSLYFTGYTRLNPGGSAQVPAFGHILGPWLSGAGYGLEIFFVLSGYLIARPFVRSFVLGRPMPRLDRYLRNRALRLLPALWFALAVVIVWTGAHGASFTHVLRVMALSEHWIDSPFNGYIQQAWSLNVEARFYLLVPIAGLLALVATRAAPVRLGRRTRGGAVLVVTAACAAASLGQVDAHPLERPFSIALLLWAFTPGVALAAWEAAAGDWFERRRRWVAPLATATFLAGAATLLEYELFFGWLQRASPLDWPLTPRVVVLLATGAIVGGPLVFQLATGRAWRLLDNRVLRTIGAWSYSVYLLHFLILTKLGPTASSHGGYKRALALLLLLGVPATLAAAAFSHRFVELPFLRLRGNVLEGRTPAWFRRRRGETAAQPGAGGQ